MDCLLPYTELLGCPFRPSRGTSPLPWMQNLSTRLLRTSREDRSSQFHNNSERPAVLDYRRLVSQDGEKGRHNENGGRARLSGGGGYNAAQECRDAPETERPE